MLDFQPVTLGIKELVDSYTFKYGEGSCQHSFVSSYCLQHKYGDMFCEHDGFLYTLRSKKCTDGQRVYLFPHGDRRDSHALRQALQNILDDAHAHNSRVKFETLTSSARDLVMTLMPGQFRSEAYRDYSEYVYSVNELTDFPAHKNIAHFFRKYGTRCELTRLTDTHIPAIKAFQENWLSQRISKVPEFTSQLLTENECISRALANYSALGLSGIVIMIDGEICGYEYGMPLSDTAFDSMAQKADRKVQDIYRVLSREFPAMCCEGCTWLNWEEDVGNPGLREAKTSYKPAFMLEKFIVTEA